MHEMSDPTPALDLVIDRVIRPRMKYLNGIVAALLGCSADDRRASLCAMSIHAQCMSLMNAQIGERLCVLVSIGQAQLNRCGVKRRRWRGLACRFGATAQHG